MRFSQVRASGAAVGGKSVQRPMAWRLINWKRCIANGRRWGSISYPRTSPRRWRSSRHLLGRLRVRATFSMSMVALRRHIHGEREVRLVVTRNIAAVDLGASSGRVLLARFDGRQFSLEEVYRFVNQPVTLRG